MDISTIPQPNITKYKDELTSGTYRATTLEDESGILKLQITNFDTLGGNFSISKASLPDLISFLNELNTELNPLGGPEEPEE